MAATAAIVILHRTVHNHLKQFIIQFCGFIRMHRVFLLDTFGKKCMYKVKYIKLIS